MPFCGKCRVELAPEARECPLCGEAPVASLEEGAVAPAPPTGAPLPKAVRDAEAQDRLTPAELRKMIVELLAVSVGIVLAVTLLVDLALFRSITWSRYMVIALPLLWLLVAMPLILWKHPWLTFAVLGPSVLIAVFLWFLASGRLDLFLLVGLPIALLLEGLIVSSGVLVAIQRRKGLNAVAVIVAAIGLACVGIDFILSLRVTGKPGLSWSIFVGISAVPLSGFFFYLHYRVMNRASLRKLFRL